MHQYEITLPLNESEQFIVQLHKDIQHISCCQNAHITFKIKDHAPIVVAHYDIDILMSDFKILLEKAIKNDLELHASITQDIGYLHNEEREYFYIHEDDYRNPDLVYVKAGNVYDWVGEQYQFWGYKSLALWLYNGKFNDIILEVTPIYPYQFADPAEHADVIPYQEWIKTYKPYFIRTVPPHIAQQWLDQAKEILAQIEKNRCTRQ